jgi:hypothetical protein
MNELCFLLIRMLYLLFVHLLSRIVLLQHVECYLKVGTLALSTAIVKLIAPDGEEKIACSVGMQLTRLLTK